MPQIKQLLTSQNRTRGRGGRAIQYIVIHYTAGARTAAGAARANCIYFAREKVGASAHYFIDDGDTIWQSVLDHDTAWSVGSSSGRYKCPARNYNTLNIEVCTDGAFTEAQIETLAWLVQKKMREYGVPASRVIRHYDVTGKACPRHYVDEKRWKALHRRITTGKAQEQPKQEEKIIKRKRKLIESEDVMNVGLTWQSANKTYCAVYNTVSGFYTSWNSGSADYNNAVFEAHGVDPTKVATVSQSHINVIAQSCTNTRLMQ